MPTKQKYTQILKSYFNWEFSMKRKRFEAKNVKDILLLKKSTFIEKFLSSSILLNRALR